MYILLKVAFSCDADQKTKGGGKGLHFVLTMRNMVSTLQDAVKVMAKSLVRNRHAVTKMYSLKSQLQAVSLRMAVSFLASPKNCAPYWQVSIFVPITCHVYHSDDLFSVYMMQTLKSTQAMADAMRGATKVLTCIPS